MKKSILRFTVTVSEDVNKRFEKIAQRYCMSRSSWIIQAALEKLEKIEREDNVKNQTESEKALHSS